MSALTSLLARDQIVPLRRIEEALQKQVMSGGDIATVLLELDALPENTLAAYSAALFGLLPATRDEVMRAPREVVRLVPREVAEKHRLVPLGVDGSTLLCALAGPLAVADEQQLAFLLGHTILARIVCDVRVAAALSHHYGIEPTPRNRRLIERLREREAGAVPYVAPPPSGKVSAGALSALGQKSRTSFLDDDDETPSQIPAAPTKGPYGPGGRGTSPMGLPRSAVPAAIAEATGPRVERTTFPIGSDRVTDVGDAPKPVAPASRPPSPLAPSRDDVSSPIVDLGGRDALAPLPPSTSLGRAPIERLAEPSAASQSAASQSQGRRHRGPLTPAAAVRLLDEASSRDEVLELLFSFARQFFDYAALFSLQEEFAEGREAFGPGASTEEIRSLRVPLVAASGLSEARDKRAPTIVQFGAREADRDLATRLGRPGAGAALLLPLAIKNRVVLVLYGDRGGDNFEPNDVPELLAFTPRVGAALERIILRKKSQRPGFEKPEATTDELKAAARGASEASRSQAGKARSLDKWAPAERTSVPPPASASAAAKRDALAEGSWGPGDPSSKSGAPLKASAAPAKPSVASKAPSAMPPATSVPKSLADTALEDGTLTAMPDVRQPAPIEPARGGLGGRGLLGIPRSAPPPPAAHIPGLAAPELANFPPRDTLPEGLLSTGRGNVPVLVSSRLPQKTSSPALAAVPPLAKSSDVRPSPAKAEAKPAPAASSEEPDIEISTSEGDSDPELSIDVDTGDTSRDDDGDAGDEDDDAEDVVTEPEGRPLDTTTMQKAGVATASAYLVRDTAVEVVGPSGRKTISSRPPPPAADMPEEPALLTKRRGKSEPAGRRDSRAEDEGVVPNAETVKVKAGARGSVAPPAARPQGRGGRNEPSVIVDMGETVASLVVDLQHAGPDDERALVEALLRLGEAALPVLAQAFPGPLWFDRRRPHRRVPRGRDVSAICRALFAFGVRATPYVASLVASSAPDRRYYALLLAGEMIHPSMLEAASGRLFDEDDGVRKLAQDVFPRFKGIAGYDEQMVIIRRAARIRGKEPRRRTDALSALAAARDVGSLDLCVELLEDEDQNVARGAHVVLVTLTCEDLGASMRKWAQWVDKNKSRHRVEWLIDALGGSDEALRTNAGDELKALTQQYFGFHPSTTRREREVAQGKYRAWWAAEGKKQFG